MIRLRHIPLAMLVAFPPTSSFAQDVEAGAGLYAMFCATCHGATARGDGPTAEIMTLQPPDLTALASANDGVFPTDRVVAQIDGRMELAAHGSPMPLFGQFFEGDDVPLKAPSGQPILTSRPIADLVSWLEAQQVKP